MSSIVAPDAVGESVDHLPIELVRGASALDALEGDWERLFARSPVIPFQNLAWMRGWLRTLGADAEVWLLRVGDPTEALFPLVLERSGPFRVLRLLGHGVSDYMGMLPLAASEACYAAVGSWLGRPSERFDWADLTGLAGPRDRVDVLLDTSARPRAQRLYEICPRVCVASDWDEYLRSRKKRFRANLKRARTRTLASGDPEVRREAATAALFDEMVAVERDSWKWEHGEAFLRNAGTRDFLRAVLVEAPAPHELWTLRFGEELAAFAISFVEEKTRYYYLPSFRKQYTDIGTYLLECIVRDAHERGLEAFDFLQGDESYKLVWCDEQNEVQQVLLQGQGPVGALAIAAYRLRWRLADSERLKSARLTLRRRTRGLREKLGL